MRPALSSATISAVLAMAGWGDMGVRKQRNWGCYFRRNTLYGTYDFTNGAGDQGV